MTLASRMNSVDVGTSSIADAIRSMSSLVHGEKSDEEKLMCNSTSSVSDTMSETSEHLVPTTAPEDAIPRKNSTLRFKVCDVTIINITKSKEYLQSMSKHQHYIAEWEIPERRSRRATICLIFVLSIIAILVGIVLFSGFNVLTENKELSDYPGVHTNVTHNHTLHIVNASSQGLDQ